jgi:hypothetical protein
MQQTSMLMFRPTEIGETQQLYKLYPYDHHDIPILDG